VQPAGPFGSYAGFSAASHTPSAPPSYEAIAHALRTLQDALPYIPQQAAPQLFPLLQQQQQQHQHQQTVDVASQFGQQQPTLEQLMTWSAVQGGPGASGNQILPFEFASSSQPSHIPQASASTSANPSAVASSSTAPDDSPSPDGELPADPEVGTAEDKRRRNTAASGTRIAYACAISPNPSF
jgi:hypothetical protein